jgi:hypothetical protein
MTTRLQVEPQAGTGITSSIVESLGLLGIARKEMGSAKGRKVREGGRVISGPPCFLIFLDKLLVLYVSTKSQVIW